MFLTAWSKLGRKEQGLVGISKNLEANKNEVKMKRVGYIYDKILDLDNIKVAIMKSSLGKRDQGRVKRIIEDIDSYALKIQTMLKNKAYTPSDYTIKTIKDGAHAKERTIYKPNYYPDQIIHWALMLQIEPIISRGMYEYTCGSVPKRGTSFGQKTLRKWLDKDKKSTKYCLKMDISKFYPSVKNEILKRHFRRVIKDDACLWLIDTIIDSAEGLPIGNYTSQWFSNFFLQGLDHFIKEEIRVKYYIRYVDDLVLLGSNKKKLHRAKDEIADYLISIGLSLKENWQVFRIDCRDIDFLGFRFYRDRTILRKRNALRIRRRCRKINKKSTLNYADASAVISYWGWLKRSDSYNFYHDTIKRLVDIEKAKRTVSNYAKQANSLRRAA